MTIPNPLPRPWPWLSRHPRIALVRLQGTITPRPGFGGGMSLASVAPMLDRAFGLKRAAAVFLVINSPGGSAVQSSLIAGRIRQLAAEKKLPVIACVEDAAASGGYWIACAADEIVADPASILGSIGVIAAGFGFSETLQRFGVERRLRTAGRRKASGTRSGRSSRRMSPGSIRCWRNCTANSAPGCCPAARPG